jgi:hypothetical protein
MTPRRGYVLLESVVGGALIAGAIGGLLVQLATASAQSTAAARAAIGARLVMGRVEELRVQGYGALTSGTVTTTRVN